MSSVTLRSVSKVYPGGVEAVRGVSVDIADGEFVVLVGPSGCGKTTTLRMIAGLEEVTSGDILIGERHVNETPPAKRDIAMVFQNYALYPHMTVRKNLSFGLRMRRTPKAEIARRVADAAALLGIEGLLDRKPRALSGGQRQRVALGRAIVRQPAAFLLDEPLSNLDAKLRGEMRGELARLQKRLGANGGPATMVYVTHDQVEAMTLGDRLVLMRDGVVQQVGPPLELYRRPANRFVASFLGSPPMNFFEGAVSEGEFRCGGDLRMAIDAPDDAPDGAAVLGIRPEDLLPVTDNLPALATGPTMATGPALATGVIESVEHLGHETLAHLTLSGEHATCRLPPGVTAVSGDALPVAARPGAAHLFAADAEGTRL
ncbi:MAG: sn-glycerol-3-phosphate ABC transporter ATP-binding protein UgpC [Planctomycetota bacterium]